MSQEKPQQRPYQFSLGQLLLSITCFAIALGLCGQLNSRERLLLLIPRIEYAFIFMYSWAIGTSIGAGIGSLRGRFWIGALIGASSVVPISFVLSVIHAIITAD